jgi:hypothetical protein
MFLIPSLDVLCAPQNKGQIIGTVGVNAYVRNVQNVEAKQSAYIKTNQSTENAIGSLSHGNAPTATISTR